MIELLKNKKTSILLYNQKNCKICDQSIEKQGIKFLDNLYHQECIKCSVCNGEISSEFIYQTEMFKCLKHGYQSISEIYFKSSLSKYEKKFFFTREQLIEFSKKINCFRFLETTESEIQTIIDDLVEQSIKELNLEKESFSIVKFISLFFIFYHHFFFLEKRRSNSTRF